MSSTYWGESNPEQENFWFRCGPPLLRTPVTGSQYPYGQVEAVVVGAISSGTNSDLDAPNTGLAVEIKGTVVGQPALGLTPIQSHQIPWLLLAAMAFLLAVGFVAGPSNGTLAALVGAVLWYNILFCSPSAMESSADPEAVETARDVIRGVGVTERSRLS